MAGGREFKVLLTANEVLFDMLDDILIYMIMFPCAFFIFRSTNLFVTDDGLESVPASTQVPSRFSMVNVVLVLSYLEAGFFILMFQVKAVAVKGPFSAIPI